MRAWLHCAVAELSSERQLQKCAFVCRTKRKKKQKIQTEMEWNENRFTFFFFWFILPFFVCFRTHYTNGNFISAFSRLILRTFPLNYSSSHMAAAYLVSMHQLFFFYPLSVNGDGEEKRGEAHMQKQQQNTPQCANNTQYWLTMSGAR